MVGVYDCDEGDDKVDDNDDNDDGFDDDGQERVAIWIWIT
jgi:hypothetical protein